MSLNQEVQQDIRCRIEITNQPDSVTMVSYLPDGINASVKSRGSQLIKYSFGTPPTISIDYKYLAHGNQISIGISEMRGLLRGVFGQNAQIISFNPDTLNLVFTSNKGVKLPIEVVSQVSTRSDFALADKPQCYPESVTVYSTRVLDPTRDKVQTMPIQHSGISETQTVRTRVVVPPGCRAFPDSINVVFKVEPLIARKIRIPITAVNVPDSVRLILLPMTVSATYMVPANMYKDDAPPIKVIADYKDIDLAHPSRRIPIFPDNTNAPNIRSIRLSNDSVEYMVER